MIRQFYVNNYKCLHAFKLRTEGQSSLLLIGKNGSGKTTVGFALEVLQRIARGTNRVDQLVTPKDFGRLGEKEPMRLELEVELDSRIYEYSIAFDFPEGFRELRVFDEKLTVDRRPIYSRELAEVKLAKTNKGTEAVFHIDWHLVALPIVQLPPQNDPLLVFKQWMAQILILRPIPGLMSGESDRASVRPDPQIKDFGAWLRGLLEENISAGTTIDQYLKQVMPDLANIRNTSTGKDSKNLEVQFAGKSKSIVIPFNDLSDGEKCFMICAMVIATNAAYSNVLCFWDEPDNYLALDEVGHFIIALRQAFQSGGQFIATSHNPEAIRRFSYENTLLLYRRSHLEPTDIRPISDLGITGDLIGTLVRGDIEL